MVHAVGRDTSTNADAIHIAREGVATGLVSIPNRYMHSPNEMVSLVDVDNAATLIAEFCRTVTDDTGSDGALIAAARSPHARCSLELNALCGRGIRLGLDRRRGLTGDADEGERRRFADLFVLVALQRLQRLRRLRRARLAEPLHRRDAERRRLSS